MTNKLAAWLRETAARREDVAWKNEASKLREAADLVEQVAEKQAWIDDAVRSCQEKRCTDKERRIAELEAALGKIESLLSDAGWTRPEDVVGRVRQVVAKRAQDRRQWNALVDKLEAANARLRRLASMGIDPRAEGYFEALKDCQDNGDLDDLIEETPLEEE